MASLDVTSVRLRQAAPRHRGAGCGQGRRINDAGFRESQSWSGFQQGIPRVAPSSDRFAYQARHLVGFVAADHPEASRRSDLVGTLAVLADLPLASQF